MGNLSPLSLLASVACRGNQNKLRVKCFGPNYFNWDYSADAQKDQQFFHYCKYQLLQAL